MNIEDLSAAAPGSVQHPHLSSPDQCIMASDPGMDQSQQSDSAPIILTFRIIMPRKEAGTIIGTKGDNIKKFTEESGARICIPRNASCPEQVFTIMGTPEATYKAFTLICNKFEEDTIAVLQKMGNSSPMMPKPPVTLRLLVPASQCPFLIGKGGRKIKEIRESTGTWMHVASEMLPNSTECVVTVIGTAEAITECICHVCTVMLEYAPDGANVPYRPEAVVSPVNFVGRQAYSLPPRQMGMPAPQMANMSHGMSMPHPVPTIIPSPQTLLPGGGVPVNVGAPGYYARPEVYPNNHVYTTNQSSFTTMHFPSPSNPNVPAGQLSHQITIPNHLPPGQMGIPAPQMANMSHGMSMPHPVPTIIPSPQTLLPGGGVPVNVGAPGYYARPEVYPNNHGYSRYQPNFTTMHFPRPANPNVSAGKQSLEITIPNDLIGRIIGRGGQKIDEIRQLSGANIQIAKAEEGSSDRKVTITGAPEMIGLAQCLINIRLEQSSYYLYPVTPR